MKTLKQLTFFLSMQLIFFFFPQRLLAIHACGMQLTYTHISGTLYKFRCEVFHNCSAVAPPPVVYMQASSSSCSYIQTYTLSRDTGQTKIIVLTCPTTYTNCVGGAAPGFETIVYEANVTLGMQCSDWLFEVTDYGRNSNITTLNNPGGTNVYVPAQLNNLTTDNNSPQFTNDPIIFVCKDQDFHYNLGIYDADGDSASYALINPRTAANTSVTYNPGYSPINPLSSTPPVSLNDFTGDLLMHPTAIEVAVFAYEVKDWRNGMLMGSVVRDVIVFTVPCSSMNPTATGMNGTSQQILYVLPDDTVCFDINSDDIDANDTVTMTWNQTIPNATFVTNGIPHPTGTFCWIPTINDVRAQPYMFTAMVNDNTCPIENACIYSYFIYVTLDSSLVWAGIENPENIFSISPNPTNGQITIQSSEKIYQIKIFNDKGACIRNEQKGNLIDISDEPAGIYLVEITSVNGKKSIQKVVKTQSD